MQIITLLTDFGDQDGFVGAVRGVLISRAPQARLVDLAHHVPPGDVEKAARVLLRAAPHFPPGTVHLVVVDPGVGSARRALAASAGGHTFVAPDNGVISDAAAALGGVEAATSLEAPEHRRPALGSTFDGRDLFAPAAAALATGIPIADLGPPITDPVLWSRPSPRWVGRCGSGRVVEIDRFGNLLTDLPWPPPAEGALAPPSRVRLALDGASVAAGPSPSYASVDPGHLVVVVGSAGTLEIAARDGSAQAHLGARVGSVVSAMID